jgi:hypothetical protein
MLPIFFTSAAASQSVSTKNPDIFQRKRANVNEKSAADPSAHIVHLLQLHCRPSTACRLPEFPVTAPVSIFAVAAIFAIIKSSQTDDRRGDMHLQSVLQLA